jgi:hypothetical protein
MLQPYHEPTLSRVSGKRSTLRPPGDRQGADEADIARKGR